MNKRQAKKRHLMNPSGKTYHEQFMESHTNAEIDIIKRYGINTYINSLLDIVFGKD